MTVPPLHRALAPALGQVEPAEVTGPRRWWAGPLDVEGLALGSVQAAATALQVWDPGRTPSVPADVVGPSFDSLRHLRVDGRAPVGFVPLSGFRECADGWVRTHANYPHHAAALRRALGLADDADQADLAAALAGRSALDVEESVVAAGGVAAAVRSPDEWEASPQGQAAAAGPWVELRDPSGAPLTLGTVHSYPGKVHNYPGEGGERPVPQGSGLGGVRVLDLTRVIAGPTGSRLLGALGADVLRIDPPQMPELLDQHVDTGFAKRSALADLRDPASLARVRELLEHADVVLLGYRAGALDRYGVSAEALLQDRPDLAVVSFDAWGEGPWSGRRGFDSIVQAACGIADVCRGPDSSPGALPVQALDHATGYGVAAAAIALLVHRRSTGEGGRARLSLARTAAELMALPPCEHPAGLQAGDALRTEDSPFGSLRYVRPPLDLDGRALEHPWLPRPYGEDALTWR